MNRRARYVVLNLKPYPECGPGPDVEGVFDTEDEALDHINSLVHAKIEYEHQIQYVVVKTVTDPMVDIWAEAEDDES